MSHPLTLAYNLLVIFVTSLVLTKHGHALKTSSLWILCSSAGAILLLSGSRFPIIMMIFCLLAFFLLELPLKKIGKILPIIALSLTVILIWEGNFLGRFKELGKSGLMRVLDDRPMFWQAHFNMFQDNPIFGVGLSGYEQAKTAHYEALQYHDKMYQAHNHYLQYLADSGLVGFLGLMALLLMLWFAGLKQYSLYRNIHLLLLAATITIAGLVQNVVRDSEFLYVFWIAIALTIGLQDRHGARKQQPENHKP
jgi:O-antigen ligase